MRKIYICKSCKGQTSVYNRVNQSNSPLVRCPECFYETGSTDIEDWADISWVPFDQDIKNSIENGSFDLMFPEVCSIQ
ncbi:hypothetical protein KAR91_27825 [Candidatus Pacearchaeota archaeon]|nr:hypothetical protein [Candidatus Pacearchaeota archaeon]